jgi:large subunit ribosomal protein L10
MNKTEKGAVVSGLKERLARASTIYVTDFTGLKVKNVTELRRRFRGLGVEYVVVKNTLAQRALKDASVSGLDAVLEGPTGLVLAGADPIAAAKVLADFQKEFERPAVKAGLVDGRVVTAADVKRLATLPSREQLLSQIAGAFQAPLAGFVGVMSSLLYQMVGALEALRSQRSSAA